MPSVKHYINELKQIFRQEAAFSVVEVLMAMMIMSLVLVALLGLLIASVSAVSTSRISTVAVQVANKHLENVHAMPYELVGLVGGNPSGTLRQDETETASGVSFTINYDVLWVDDSVDGTSTADEDGPQDYKQVTVSVYWNEEGTAKTVSFTTYIKYKPWKSGPPVVAFLIGDVDYEKTPPDGTLLGLDDSPYKDWFDGGLIPLKATASDDDSDLVSMRFTISGQEVDGASYEFLPTGSYENNPTARWDPNATDNYGERIWYDGTHEVVVEAFDSKDQYDRKTIYWTVDQFPPRWLDSEPANLAGQALDASRIRLTWQAAWDGLDKASKYNIHRRGPGEGSFSVIESNYNTTSYTYENTGLSQWSTYQYYLTALSVGGRESTATSNVASATTMFTVTGTPYKTLLLIVKVRLDWNAPPGGVTVHHYDIYRNGNKINLSPVSGSAVSYTDTGLLMLGTYRYQVKAYNGSNQLINQSVPIDVYIPLL